jgi:DNA modification methylase
MHYTGISRAMQSRGGIHMQRNRTPLQTHISSQNQPELSIGDTIHPKNTLNDMSGDRFLYFTKSVLSTSYPSVYSHELRRKHGANKPPQLMALLIEFFTKTGMSVLDPFAGVGGTLIGASIATPGARRCIGIEINHQWTDIYAHVLKDNPGLLAQTMIQGDCIEVMDRLLADKSILDIEGHEVRVEEKDTVFDFIVMDPPYNIHLEQTMSGNGGKLYAERYANRRSDYNMRSDNEFDLANLATYDGYLDAMSEVFQRCFRLLRPGRYMAIIVRNAYQQAEYMFTHVDLARRAASVGFIPKGEIIWYQAGTKLRPYGYPYSYVPNIAHQNIVILQRPPLGRLKKTKLSR